MHTANTPEKNYESTYENEMADQRGGLEYINLWSI